jgi:hypothetical protein
MPEMCENLMSCNFFKDFKGNTEVVKNGWIRLFCEDKEKSEHCQRKQLKKKTGTPPPLNMSPTGKML